LTLSKNIPKIEETKIMEEEKYNNIFIGFLIGFFFVIVMLWLFGGSNKSPEEKITDCLESCQEEGEFRPSEWLRDCENSCMNYYEN